jgi:hypothetical protein
VWGEELFFDATKVEANASMESRIPRPTWASSSGTRGCPRQKDARGPSTGDDPDALPAAQDNELRAKIAERGDWISKDGRPDPTMVRHHYRRKSDYVVSPTDPDTSLMQQKGGHHAAGLPRPLRR